MKVELHCHSNCSDGLASVGQILKHAEKIGLGAIAITDHDKMNSLEETKKYQGDLIIIPGVEINSDKGHILVLGSEEMPPRTMDEIIDFAKSHSAVAIAAHPYGGVLRPGPAGHLHKFHAVEVLNGRTFSWKNKKAMKEAENLSKVSGSDAHLLKEVGSFACEIDADSVDSVLKQIKKGNVIIPGKSRTVPGILWKTWETKLFYKLR